MLLSWKHGAAEALNHPSLYIQPAQNARIRTEIPLPCPTHSPHPLCARLSEGVGVKKAVTNCHSQGEQRPAPPINIHHRRLEEPRPPSTATSFRGGGAPTAAPPRCLLLGVPASIDDDSVDSLCAWRLCVGTQEGRFVLRAP